jgi:hypothetical protein
MSIYMVNDHIRHSYLLGVHKIKENYIAENIYELVNNSLKESGGMDPFLIAKQMVCLGSGWSISNERAKEWPLC